MATINEACKHIVEKTEHALAVGIVDLSSGLLLGVHHTIPYFTQSFLDAIAAAAVDMFRGQAISAVSEQFAELNNGEPGPLLQAQMTTDKTHHFMSVIPRNTNALVVLIMDKNINLKAGWASLHSAIPELTPFCP